MDRKAIAMAAVLAVAAAAVALSLPLSQEADAATGDYQPMAYAKDSNVRAILYEDKSVMIDLSAIETSKTDHFYKVK